MPLIDTDLSKDMDVLNTEDPEKQIMAPPAATDEDNDEEEVPVETVEEDETKDEENEEKEEETDEEVDPALKALPSFKDVKAKYPDFFKDFPELRTSFFRDREYVKVFPTIEDAKEAFEDNEAFTTLRTATLAGDVKPMMEAMTAAGKDSLEVFSRNFLPELYKRDSGIYGNVVTPIFENLVRNMYATGSKYNNDAMKTAALEASKFLFDDDGVATGHKQVSTPTPAPKKEESAETTVRFVAARNEVSDSITKTLNAEIRAGLDPNNVMAPFLRRKAIDEIRDRIGKQLELDAEHMKIMHARWARAAVEGYDDSSKRKVAQAFLTRARVLLPSIRAKVQADALGTTKSVSKERERQGAPAKKEITNGRVPSTGNGKVESKQIDWKRTSDLDILNDAPTLRK